jgi:hypothetical protein
VAGRQEAPRAAPRPSRGQRLVGAG